MVQDIEQIGVARVQKLFNKVRITEYEFLWNCSIRANGNSVPITSSSFATKEGAYDYKWRLKFNVNFSNVLQGCNVALWLESDGSHGADNKMNGSVAIHSLKMPSTATTPLWIFYQDDFVDLPKVGKKMEATISDSVLREVWEELFFKGLKLRLTIKIAWEDSAVHDCASTQLSVDFEKLYVDGAHSTDVAFVFDNNEEIRAHKLILMARSPVFQAMFQSDMLESKRNRVEIKDVDADTFEKLMRYIYTGKMDDAPADKVADILLGAEKYALIEFRDHCANEVTKLMNVENAANNLVVSSLLNLDSLKSKAVEFILRNRQEVLKTDGYKNLRENHPRLVAELFENTQL